MITLRWSRDDDHVMMLMTITWWCWWHDDHVMLMTITWWCWWRSRDDLIFGIGVSCKILLIYECQQKHFRRLAPGWIQNGGYVKPSMWKIGDMTFHGLFPFPRVVLNVPKDSVYKERKGSHTSFSSRFSDFLCSCWKIFVDFFNCALEISSNFCKTQNGLQKNKSLRPCQNTSTKMRRFRVETLRNGTTKIHYLAFFLAVDHDLRERFISTEFHRLKIK